MFERFLDFVLLEKGGREPALSGKEEEEWRGEHIR